MMFRIAMIVSVFAIACGGGKDDSGADGAEGEGEGEGAGACDNYLAALSSCEGIPQETIDQMEEAMDAGTATEEVCQSYLDAFDSAGGCDAYGG